MRSKTCPHAALRAAAASFFARAWRPWLHVSHIPPTGRALARRLAPAGARNVADEVRGRVAVVRAGDYVALAVASWPMGAPPEVVDDVDAMIGSLGPVPGALPPGVF